MSTAQSTRHFVAISTDGKPVSQRTSSRANGYRSASPGGGCFSKNPPNAAYPLRVVEVPAAIEWVARGVLSDGTKIVERSKAANPGTYAVRFEYPQTQYREGQPAQITRADVTTRYSSMSEFRRRYQDNVVLGDGALEVTIRNWPVPGDAIVLKGAA